MHKKSKVKRRQVNRCVVERVEDRLYYQATSFTLQSASSKLTVGMSVSGATATSQGTSSLNSAESSLTTHFTGTIQTDLTGQNLTFTSGSAVTAQNNGTWLPNSSLSSPGQPANFAGIINLGFLFGNVYVAARNWVFGMTSPQYTVPPNGSFSTGESLSVVTSNTSGGTVYYSNLNSFGTTTSLGGTLINGNDDNDSSGTDMNSPISVANATLISSGGTETLTVPINSEYSETVEGLLVTFSYAGTLTATAPAPAAAVTLTGSNYLELDPTTAGQLDVWSGTTNTGTPTSTYKLSQAGSLVDAGTSGNDTVTVDFTNGNPLATVTPGLSFNSIGTSGGADNLLIVGDSHGDTYTASTNQISVSGGTGASAFTAVPISFANIASESIQAGIGPDTIAVTGTQPLNYIAPAGGSHPFGILSSLSIGTGSKVIFNSPNTNRALLELSSVGNWTGQLDLKGNDLLVHGGATAFTTVNTLVSSGFNQGAWTGQGITSSLAATNSTHLTALGVILNSQGLSFDGAPILTTDVLVKYTYYGDDNFDGKVDGSDYSRIDSGFLTHATGWSNGDFNDDGFVNGSDYTLIDNAFNRQSVTFAASIDPANTVAAPPTGHVANAQSPATFVSQGVFSIATPLDLAKWTDMTIERSLRTHDLLDGLTAAG